MSILLPDKKRCGSCHKHKDEDESAVEKKNLENDKEHFVGVVGVGVGVAEVGIQ